MIERILSLIDNSGMTDYALQQKLGFSMSTIRHWRIGKNQVSTDAVIKLARYFNISADYLLGLTNDPKQIRQGNLMELPNVFMLPELSDLSQDNNFVDIARLYKAMSNERKKQIYGYVTGVADGIGLDTNKIINK